jgi:hypothetical protein
MCVFASVVVAAGQGTTAQKQDKNPDVFQLGIKTVRIPTPTGFTDVMGRIPNTKKLYARDDPNGIIALSVPDEVFPQLKADPLMPLPFYAVVIVTEPFKTLDITPELFAQYVVVWEKEFGTFLDLKGPVIADAKKRIDSIRNPAVGGRSHVEFLDTKYLGVFEKVDNAFSAMFMATVQVDILTRRPVLASFSALRIKDRLITLTVYEAPTEKNLETLPVFTKQWTAAIIAANK